MWENQWTQEWPESCVLEIKLHSLQYSCDIQTSCVFVGYTGTSHGILNVWSWCKTDACKHFSVGFFFLCGGWDFISLKHSLHLQIALISAGRVTALDWIRNSQWMPNFHHHWEGLLSISRGELFKVGFHRPGFQPGCSCSTDQWERTGLLWKWELEQQFVIGFFLLKVHRPIPPDKESTFFVLLTSPPLPSPPPPTQPPILGLLQSCDLYSSGRGSSESGTHSLWLHRRKASGHCLLRALVEKGHQGTIFYSLEGHMGAGFGFDFFFLQLEPQQFFPRIETDKT